MGQSAAEAIEMVTANGAHKGMKFHQIANRFSRKLINNQDYRYLLSKVMWWCAVILILPYRYRGM